MNVTLVCPICGSETNHIQKFEVSTNPEGGFEIDAVLIQFACSDGHPWFLNLVENRGHIRMASRKERTLHSLDDLLVLYGDQSA